MVMSLVFALCQGQPFPFMNVSLSFDDRVKVSFVSREMLRLFEIHPPLQDLVGRLTVDEMVAQMSHGGAESNGSL